MSLKYTCPSCGTPLGYEGLCWKCKCEQERQAALAWMPEQIVEKQRNLIQNIQRLADMENPEFADFWQLLGYHDAITPEIQRVALAAEVFWPCEIYYHAPADVRDGLIHALLSAEYSSAASNLMSCLAMQGDDKAMETLLEHGADPGLAEEQPLLLTAARCCGPEVVALFAEQAAKLSSKQKERAFQEVRWGQRAENIQVLEQAGITVEKFGGEAFRAAVYDGNTKLARLLLKKGADINYHKPDMVFPNAPTAVTEAARHNDFSMVRWLVEQGADITIADKYGDRPYTVAVQNKNQELADYLKALEPEEWHNEQEKVRQLTPYKLPAKLVEYLKTGPLRLEFPERELVKWAELYPYMDVQEMTWKRKKLLSLMVQMDNYSDYLLLWSPRDKKLWYLDIEHEEFHPLAKWDDFIADPGRYLNGMIEGEFEE